MDTLIKQLSQFFEKSSGVKKDPAAGKALEEIVLSGLSRSGFMKTCLYMPEFNHRLKNDISLYFLCRAGVESIPANVCLSFLRYELDSAGLEHDLTETPYGYRIGISNGGEKYQISIYVIRMDAAIDPVIEYRHVPLAYEIRYAEISADALRSDVQKAIASVKKSEKADAKTKKGAEKAPKQNKRKKAAEEQPVQPTLFDF